MREPVSDRDEMVAQMAPLLDDQAYCFLFISPEMAPTALGSAIGTFREDEGVTAIVPEGVRANWATKVQPSRGLRCGCIPRSRG